MSILPAAAPPAEPATWAIPPECIPDVTDIVISDGAAVDGLLTEKQMRLLTEPLYSSWRGPGNGGPFAVLANVGLFHTYRKPAIVPDVMLSLDVTWPEDLHEKEHNSYFVWVIGKVPDVAIEIVSNREGGEDTHKLQTYARLRVPYFAIYDPGQLLHADVLRVFELRSTRYRACAADWLEEVGLGLRLWEGKFEGMQGTWLRWADRSGQVIRTGAEGQDLARRRADAEHQRAEDALREIERLREMLRQSGTEPGRQQANGP